MENKSRIIILIAGIIIIGTLIFGAWKFRGALPAVTPAPSDIGEIPAPSTSTVSGGPITLPAGFSLNIFAKNLNKPRVMATDGEGNLVVSVPSDGTIVALPDADENGIADRNVIVLSGLNKPHGILFDCNEVCKLYVAEETRLMRYTYDSNTFKTSDAEKLLDLPDGGRHTTRTLLRLDNQLLISIGSTCDVCREKNPWHGSVIATDLNGKNPRIFANGLRNAVFLARHPVDGRVWVTEMGRDMLGDDLPPDEINILQDGKNYGWPICYGKNIHDTQFDKNQYIQNPCAEPNQMPSHIDVPAHSAPLGITFVPEEGWPEELWHHALVAYHGSWNRSTPTGYKIARVKLSAKGEPQGFEDFATGWLTGSRSIGRPVDLLARPGGLLYVTDDKAGAVYRITYAGKVSVNPTQPKKVCKPTGCSGEICSDVNQSSICIYKPEFACYKAAICEIQVNGECGWTDSNELKACLKNPPQN